PAPDGPPLIVDVLPPPPNRTRVENELLAAGYRSLVAAPLFYEDTHIGSFELISTEPGALNVTHTPSLLQVLPLFAVAVKRSMDELESRIQALIKEQCTAIHPTVEWRVRQAALASFGKAGAADD